MPREFVYRRKQGFGAPIKEWLRTENTRQFVQKNLLESSSLGNIFNTHEIVDLLDNFYKKNNESVQYKIWTLLCLALWFKSHQKHHE